MRAMRVRVGMMIGVLLALVGCSGKPAVHFFDEGQPATLDQWHVLRVEGGKLRLNDGVVPYDLNTPLFSDYAHKLRTVWMPEGKAAGYQPENAFDFPVGTILSKTFYYPLPAGGGADAMAVARTPPSQSSLQGEVLDLSRVRLIETRLLVHRQQGWVALPYVWNREQTIATLKRTGDTVELELVDAAGAREALSYQVPDQNQCGGCHITDNRSRKLLPIGPKARNLNRDFDYAGGRENQLAHLARVGYLQGAPAPAQAPRAADATDPQASLDARARAYLDVNCGHCHSRTGPAITSGLWLDAPTRDHLKLGLCKQPIAAGKGTGNRLYDVLPGDADASIIAFRMDSDDPAVMMPELGRAVVHKEGLALIRQWINGLEGSCDTTAGAGPVNTTGPPAG
ncbi:SO2930 family diheme c-type cytochrome [Stenotrophomonas sp. MH1]|uniref:SO2930 family diheme c-type cytochrome n=1 Tax=Stenotrophomonas capsici TaxID=3110230 RepID=A0ABU5V6Y7_9GAMM|nr:MULTISPECIES: SO2930 family diheme c-type cytochrome [unclassified Stenotrophomonas]MEA5668573.1 SO2930 family diheme c-type cytochrome [Stenotrophomonas sp. MH1]